MKNWIVSVLLLAMLGCGDPSEEPRLADLEGIWVDSLTATDTLEFLVFDDGGSLMLLNRGKEIRDGYNLPKIGSGSYSFELQNNSIKLQYSLSSNWNPTDYYFRYNPLQLKIGRFFESDNSAAILTFRKVK